MDDEMQNPTQIDMTKQFCTLSKYPFGLLCTLVFVFPFLSRFDRWTNINEFEFVLSCRRSLIFDIELNNKTRTRGDDR